MKKLLALLTVSAFMLIGCDSKNANAQTQVSANVGNPDSANMLIVQEGLAVVTPNAQNIAQPNAMQPLAGEAGVDVAPANIPSAPVTTPAPMQNSANIAVDETISPNTSVYQIDETVN